MNKLALILLLFSFSFPRNINAQSSLSISNIFDNRSDYVNNDIPMYEKFELTFDINNINAVNFQLPYLSPQNDNQYIQQFIDKGITVYGVFLPPGETDWNKAYKQPGFYYQEFTDIDKEGKDWRYPTGISNWKVRFAPHKTGDWKYMLTAQDKGGFIESPVNTFTVSDSDNKGMIRVSQNDPRYFEYSNGTYFPNLGYQGGSLGDSDLQLMKENGIEYARWWMMFNSTYGSQWSHWRRYPRVNDGYLPRVPTVWADLNNDGKSEIYYNVRHYSPGGSNWFSPCINLDSEQPLPSVKQNTNYYFEITYQAKNLQALDNSKPHGLVMKHSTSSSNCMNSGSGEIITNYGTQENDFGTVKGIWKSGNNNFLKSVVLALENNRLDSDSIVYISSLSMREMSGGTIDTPELTGPNHFDKPNPYEHTYMAHRPAFAIDKAIEKFDSYGLKMKAVLLEKHEHNFSIINKYGIPDGVDNGVDKFYGAPKRCTTDCRDISVSRWLQEAWYRYVQARWGYSKAIHSWELLNEGDPDHYGHFAQTDEMGKTFRCRVFDIPVSNTEGAKCSYDHPNAHPVTTSFWHSFPGNSFWKNSKYPNIDYADVHAYISTSNVINFSIPGCSKSDMEIDAALYHVCHSSQLVGWNIGMPIVRGEAGMDVAGSQSSNALKDKYGVTITEDAKGTWLHNYIWAGIHTGALIETYWWSRGHIYDRNGAFDFRYHYKPYFDFISNIPLNNGNYEDVQAASLDASLRVWGQKDVINNRAHFWVHNPHHTWKNVLDGVNITAVTSDITINGFSPNKSLKIEEWDTYSGTVKGTTNLTTNGSGELTLSVSNITSDTAFKIGDYFTTSPIPTSIPSIPGDANGDGKVDGLDYIVWLNHYDTLTENGSEDGDFDSNGTVDGLDYLIWLNNYSG